MEEKVQLGTLWGCRPVSANTCMSRRSLLALACRVYTDEMQLEGNEHNVDKVSAIFNSVDCYDSPLRLVACHAARLGTSAIT